MCSNPGARDAKRRNRVKVLTAYSRGPRPRCECCGDTHVEFLTIDHVGGGGRKHRRAIGIPNGGSDFYAWLIRNDYPVGFRVLCHNCNSAIGLYGYCPHAAEAIVTAAHGGQKCETTG